MLVLHWSRLPTPAQRLPFIGHGPHPHDACLSLATHYIHAILVPGINLLILPTAECTSTTSAMFIAGEGDILRLYPILCRSAIRRNKWKSVGTKIKWVWWMQKKTPLQTISPFLGFVVVGDIGTVPKNIAKRQGELAISGRVENIQTTVLLKSARVFKRVLKIWENFLSLRL